MPYNYPLSVLVRICYC